MTGFPKTKASIEKLIDLLRCENCSRTLYDPYTTGVCSHTLCFECCKSVAPTGSRSKKHSGNSNVCPLCYTLVRPCDIKPHPQLHNLVLIARRLVKLFGSEESTNSSLTATESKGVGQLHDNLAFLNSADYYRFESPSPSRSEKVHLRHLDSSDISTPTTAISPVECSINSSAQPVVLAGLNEDVEHKGNVDSMPPPPVPTAKKSSRGRQSISRRSLEKPLEKSLETNTDPIAKSKTKAPLASPEQSGMVESVVVSPLITSSPEQTVSTSSIVESLNSAPGRRSREASAIGNGEAGLKLNSKGECAVHRAAIKNDVRQLKRLLDDGLSPDVRDHAGWTPLHEAALRGHVEAVECLLGDGKATVDVPGGPDLETPLHEAVSNRHVEVVRVLLSYNASPTFVNGQGISPLEICNKHLGDANQAVVSTTLAQKRRRSKHESPVESLKDFQTIHDLLTSAAVKLETKTISVVGSDLATSALFLERRRLKPLLLATGLNRNQKNILTRVANLIHARVATNMSSEITHLITGAQMIPVKQDKSQNRGKNKKGKEARMGTPGTEGVTCPRTLKFLAAVLQGCWVLSFDWVETCETMKMRVDEEAFEVTGCSTAPNSFASRRGRKAREGGSVGLFYGYRFCLLGNFAYPTPDRSDLCNLLTCGGATFFSRDITSPSRLAYLAVDDPIIAEAWMVQQDDASTKASGPDVHPMLASGDGDATVHPHQLIALYDPRTSGLLNTPSPREEASAVTATKTIAGKPEDLVRAAQKMLQLRLQYSSISPAASRPIRLVPATWIMDCIANYTLLPLPTVKK